ncbi:hypothetical protein AVEN_243341-1 [Araneus ventricosus]|uniref:Uncharacterized protein n=1 Tax=Araneus ventricosus TaxID=182803 RepID=A0A4Y2HBD9_ARAVE|nr:hypothetical protein AVEN_243341-1 [Araneus ventricosus]
MHPQVRLLNTIRANDSLEDVPNILVRPEGSGTDGRRWEQDRDYRRDGQTPPSETAAAVAAKKPPHDGERGCGAASQR